MNTFPAFSKETYIKRRDTLKKIMGKGRLLILGNEESSINFKDNWYTFRQDSTFLYYVGVSAANLAFFIDIDAGEEILFGNELSIDDIIWTGPQSTLHELADEAGIKKVLPMAGISKYLKQGVAYLPPYRPEHTLKLAEWLDTDVKVVEASASVEFIKAVASQRSCKSEEELAQLDKACTVTSRMHRAVMMEAREGMYEHEVAAIAQKVLWENYAANSFLPIVTTNGNVLHNHYYGNRLVAGKMLLFDGGAELQNGYCGDMTRTIPVEKKFSSKQREIYEIVYAAYQKAISLLKPGIRFKDIHLAASLEMVNGLKQLDLMKGDAADAVASGAHTMFFQCGLGHMLGLDVHDMENLGEQYIGYNENLAKSKDFGLKSLRLGKELQEGYVLTVEPGIYIIPELIDLWWSKKMHTDFINYELLNRYRDFGGIRIENDFAITQSGGRLLGEPLAIAAEDVEALRA
jgi:Xaa-Pro aminopeptidase